jgi:glycosyltransferase involved in cell wall biosynthesis
MSLKVLHVLYQSLPDRAGSSIRSRDIVASQKLVGLEVVVLTSPFQKPETAGERVELIEEIKYYRSYSGAENETVSEKDSSFGVKLKKFLRLFAFVKQLKEIALEEEVDVLHAHATFFCGLSAAYVGRKLGIPVVYEVRSLWEERQLKSKPGIKTRLQVGLIRRLETLSMKRASHVIPINKNLLDNVKQRGISNQKLTMVPNAVNLDRIPKLEEKKHDQLHFAYIGSLSPIEGLEDLCRQIHRMRTEGKNCGLLIYGGGVSEEVLKKLIEEEQLEGIQMMGSVQPAEVYKAYQEVQVIVNPRIPSKITHSVTPLKPLEAMGYQKLVLASDVGGMKELIQDQKTGFLFEAGNPEALYRQLCFIYDQWDQTGAFQQIKSQALSYVREHKSWRANAEIYLALYKQLQQD